MITLPEDFVETRYPGYFWNIKEKKLYSVKVTGALKPLARPVSNFFNNYNPSYKVSVNGQRRSLFVDYLTRLKPKKSVFPVYNEQMKLL